uniref:Inositol polyphosphate-related phosphatase domain-containing protein n=1 Tax=Aegilops tauschii subsp. strangulata TaxID=200361 RepID=A0A453E872_AEGTS
LMSHPVFLERSAEESLDAAPYKLRRRNSETMRAQYISTKELRICIGTYNAAGIEPPEGLDIAEWLGTTGGEQADMYVLGFQEVVPLNAGNVLGAEDVRPALAWEALIRDTLTRTQPSCSRPKYRYRSHPATPTQGAPEDDEQDGQDRARLAGAAAGPDGHRVLVIGRAWSWQEEGRRQVAVREDREQADGGRVPDHLGAARPAEVRPEHQGVHRGRGRHGLHRQQGVGVGEHVHLPDHVLLRLHPPVRRRAARQPPQAERRRAGDPPADALRRPRRPRAAPRHLRPREDFLAGRSELPDRRAVRQNPRPDRRHGLASASRERSAEAGAEEGAGVRGLERGGAGVRADVQVRDRDGQVHRRRPERGEEDAGVVRPGAVVREGGEAAGLREVGADAVGPQAGDGDVRGGGGGVLRAEAAEGAHAHGRRGRERGRGRAGPRVLSWLN